MPTLNWIGKEAVVKHHKEVPFRMLQPVAALSYGEASNLENENLIVQGDNLHALKALLPRYAGQVKCIYIDPPYNTGNEDWVYNDNVNSPEITRWLGEVVGKEGETLDRHDRWLCMMYPRLLLLKQFLRDDGAIFVSIDDNEVASLRLLMDEIFGESNFIECITWNKRIPKNDAGIGNIHEYILIYRKSATWDYEFTMKKDGLDKVNDLLDKLKSKKIPIPLAEAEVRKLFKDEGYDRGVTLYNSLDKNYRLWGKINMSWPNANTFGPRYKVLHPVTNKPVKIPDRGWRWKPDTLNAELGDKVVHKLEDGSYMVGKIWFGKDENIQTSSIKYLDEVNRILLRSVLSLKSDGGIDVEEIFGEKATFAYPKPTNLLQVIIDSLKMQDGDIVFDSFAGSGTTAHAVLRQNVEDGINRRFILVEMNENIAQNVTVERVKRVAKGYSNAKGEVVAGLGGSFKFCKLSKEPLFTAEGQIRSDVTFAELAEFVWFTETGTGYPQGLKPSPLLGVHQGKAVYLLFNGILKDRGDLGGNVLNNRTLAVLPAHDGQRVVYGARTRFDKAKLSRMNIEFKQLPYELTVKSWV